MADLEKTVSIIFSGVDKTGDVFKGLSRNIDTFAGDVKGMTDPLANVAGKFELFGAGVATAIGLAGGAAITATGDFNESFAEIATIIGKPVDALGDFREAVLSYAKDSRQPLSAVTDALYGAISAGIPYADAIDAIRQAEQLTVAGRGDFQSTTETIAGLLNAYGDDASKASDYSDKLFKTVALGQTTLSDMAGKLGPLVSIAASAGVPFDQLAAAIATLTSQGVPTSQAIDGIRAAISNIIKPSGEAKKEAEDLGIAFNAQELKAKGLPGLLAEISQKTNDNIQPTSVLFGDVTGLAAALGLSKDGAAKYKDAMNEVQNSNGIVKQNFELMSDEISNIHQNLANNVRTALISLGDGLIDKYSGIVKDLSTIFGNIDFQDDSFSPLMSMLDDVAQDIANFISDVAKNLPEALAGIDWSPLEGSFENLKEMFKGVIDAIAGENVDLGTAEGLRTFIQEIVKAFAGIDNVIAGIGTSWTPFIETFVNGLKKAADSDADTQNFVGNLLGLGQAINVIAGLGGGAAGVLGGVASILSTLVNLKLAGMVTNLGGVGTNLGIIKSVGAIALPVTISIVGGAALSKLVYSLLPSLEKVDKKAFKVTVDFIANYGGKIWDLLIGNAAAQVKEWAGQLDDAIREALGGTNFDSIQSDFDAISLELEANVDTFTDFADVQKEWDSLNLQATAFMETHTDFDSIQSDWNAITDEMGKNPIPLQTDFDKVQQDWDDLNDDFAAHPIVVHTKPDKDNVKDTIKKIQQTLSESSVGDVNIGVKINGTGVGPSGTYSVGDMIKESFKDSDPVPLDDIIDLGGLSDLLDSIKGLDSQTDKRELTDAAIKIAQAQKEVIDAERRNLDVRSSILEDEWRKANYERSTSEVEQTIKIEASGLEIEMEAFMWKLLKKVQLRASKTGAEFLLAAAS